jgi:hypothetical protein
LTALVVPSEVECVVSSDLTGSGLPVGSLLTLRQRAAVRTTPLNTARKSWNSPEEQVG